MKVFNICAIFVVLAINCAKADWKEDMQKHVNTCKQEVTITQEELDKFFKGGMDPGSANDAIKCHIKCVMEKQGLLKNGAFDEQAFVKQAQEMPTLKDHQAEVIKAGGDCKKETGANDCDTAFKIMMCLKAKKAAVLGTQ